VKGISDYLGKHPTKTDVNNGPAIAKIDRLEARIKAIRQGRVPGLDANTDAARAKIAELQAQIDALHGKTFTIGSHGLQFSNGQGGVIQRAAGGTVPGVGNTDSQPAMLTPGEEVISKGPATKNRALLKAINSGAVVAYARAAPSATRATVAHLTAASSPASHRSSPHRPTRSRPSPASARSPPARSARRRCGSTRGTGTRRRRPR
jgi:hypothetical protein